MKNRLPIFIVVVLAVVFGLGVFHLVRLRYEVGDVYPEYSSLRSDPLGTMALFESLEQLPGMSVHRDFSSDNRLPEERNATYLHLAATTWEWTSMPEEIVTELEGFLTHGGRLVVAFAPETGTASMVAARMGPTSPRKQSARTKAEEDRQARRTSLNTRWGFQFAHEALVSNRLGQTHTGRAANETDLQLPAALEWHSTLVFTNLGPDWQTIYARDGQPVLVERRFGTGSVVMSTDSYYLSNEALTRSRHADLLAWLIGPAKAVYFDEAHLGIVESPGVATLMRRYHLIGFGLALLALAALFVWKNSASFLPPYLASEPAQSVLGRDAAAGFVNLLRRNVPTRDLLQVCFDQWTRSLAHSGHLPIARTDQAQAVYEAENARAKVERDPVRAYRAICEALHSSVRPATANSKNADRSAPANSSTLQSINPTIHQSIL